MTALQHPTRGTVLISGASIAGPTLAYWLHRYGFAVTVVEQASAPRDGGYPIDIRGTAVDVVRRMGILPRLRDAKVDIGRFSFFDADGGTVATLHPDPTDDGAHGRDLEVARGDLTAALYTAVRNDVEFVFADSIATLQESPNGVDVTLHSGRRCHVDLVIGADGMHSATRSMVFGPEDQFHRYLGYAFAIFTMPNSFRLAHELMLWNTPGRAAALYATGDDTDDLHAFLNFYQPDPPRDALHNPDRQWDLINRIYQGAGWKVPAVVAALQQSDDVFFDTAGQIRLPRWSSGRVALVGDAAYAPSFLTGQGSSLALVGAYMLAHALAAYDEHEAAFAAYERETRDFVAENQALVDNGGARLFPITAEALQQRNARLRGRDTMPSAAEQPAHTALTLPAPAA